MNRAQSLLKSKHSSLGLLWPSIRVVLTRPIVRRAEVASEALDYKRGKNTEDC